MYCSPLGVNVPSRGHISPLGVRGEVNNQLCSQGSSGREVKCAYVKFLEPESASKAVAYNVNAKVHGQPVFVTW
jgi:hypothetical protein